MKASVSSWMRGVAVATGVVAAVAMAPSVASATPLTVSETVSVPSTATNWSRSLNFAGFNSFNTGGTLQSVTIDLTETMAGTAAATNTGSTTATGDFVFTNQAKLDAGALGVVTNVQTSATISILAGATSPTQTLSGSNSNTQTFTSSLAQFLPGWTGSGSDSGAEALSFSGGNLNASFTDNGALSVLVTYTYSATPPSTPVPEPGSVAMLGMALLGLGCVRFKRA